MDPEPTTGRPADRTLDDIWRREHGYVVALAQRMVGDRAGAEDVAQEAFGRLDRIGVDEIDDARGWLTVVARRLCLDRLRSAQARRESPSDMTAADLYALAPGQLVDDPADRVTLDDQVQLALAVVLDRLTPAERTAFVLHDVFGFPFDSIAEIVGRTPAACRQLASRARTATRSGAPASRSDGETADHRVVVDRFIAACAGGDIGELMAVLDPSTSGEAALLGHGPLAKTIGRPMVARRLLDFFGPGSGMRMVAMPIEGRAGVIAVNEAGDVAVLRLEIVDRRVHHINSWIRHPF